MPRGGDPFCSDDDDDDGDEEAGRGGGGGARKKQVAEYDYTTVFESSDEEDNDACDGGGENDGDDGEGGCFACDRGHNIDNDHIQFLNATLLERAGKTSFDVIWDKLTDAHCDFLKMSDEARRESEKLSAAGAGAPSPSSPPVVVDRESVRRTIRKHQRHHSLAPTVLLSENLHELRRVRRMFSKCLMKRNKETGEITPAKENIEGLQRTVRLMLELQRCRPENMLFHTGN